MKKRKGMKAEYRYLLIFGAWMVLWTVLPPVAFILTVFYLVKTFCDLRRERKSSERRRCSKVRAAMAYDDDPKMRDWMRMEGFDVPDEKPARKRAKAGARS